MKYRLSVIEKNRMFKGIVWDVNEGMAHAMQTHAHYASEKAAYLAAQRILGKMGVTDYEVVERKSSKNALEYYSELRGD